MKEISIKASKFSEAQIAFVLKQADEGNTVAEVCRKASIGVATFYNWCKKYAGLMPSENERFKRMLAKFGFGVSGVLFKLVGTRQ